jgi:hypothetical protein
MTSDAPSFARDNLRRPTVDLRGVISGLGAVGDEAGKPAYMSNQLAAPYGAIADLGRTIAEAGGAVGALMVKRREAKAKNQSFDAELELANANQALAEHRVANPTDTESWETARQKTVADLERRIANNDKLLPEVRENLTRKLKMFDAESKAQTFKEASVAEFRQAKSATIAEMERAGEAGDQESWQRSAQEGLQKGWLYPHEVQNGWQAYQSTQNRKAKEAEAAAEKSYMTSTLAQAAQNPKDWLARYPEAPEGVDPMVHLKTRNAVEAMARDGDAYIASTVGGMIAAGQITVPTEIDALAETTPGFTPDLVAEYKEMLGKYDARKAEIAKASRGDEMFVKHWIQAEKINFDAFPDDASKAKAFNKAIVQAKLEVPEDRLGEVTSLLHQKYGARDSADSTPGRPESQRLASRGLANSYRRGEFGALEKYDPKAKDGKGDWVPDPVAEQQAMTRMAQAEAQMTDFFKAHPDAGPTEVATKLDEVKRAHKASKAAGTILLAPPKARAPVSNGPTDWTRYLKDAPMPVPAPTSQTPPFSPDDTEPPPGPPPPSVRSPATKQQKLEDDKGALLDLEPGASTEAADLLLPDIGIEFDAGIYDRSPSNPVNQRTR